MSVYLLSLLIDWVEPESLSGVMKSSPGRSSGSFGFDSRTKSNKTFSSYIVDNVVCIISIDKTAPALEIVVLYLAKILQAIFWELNHQSRIISWNGYYTIDKLPKVVNDFSFKNKIISLFSNYWLTQKQNRP